MVLVSISLSSTVSIASEIADWLVELALPVDSTPIDQYSYKSYNSLLLQQKYLLDELRFSICYNSSYASIYTTCEVLEIRFWGYRKSSGFTMFFKIIYMLFFNIIFMTDNLTLQKSSTFLILRNTKYNKNHYNNAKKGLQLECGKIAFCYNPFYYGLSEICILLI